jgi:hypothetical protein
MALRTLNKEERVCLLGLVALSLPVHDQALGDFNNHLLTKVCGLLSLKEHHWRALQPLLHSEGNDLEIRQAQLQAFLKPFMVVVRGEESGPTAAAAAAGEVSGGGGGELLLEPQDPPQPQQQAEQARRRYLILRDLLVHLACLSMYDARTRRVMVRLALDALGVEWHDMACIEALTASHLHEIWEASQAKDKVHKGLRYAKITAAALGGGALLALTGGLAAPAIGVGLSALSATGAMVAGFTTTASVATLFGASGAGLVGFKMKRRTAALDQFEFRHVERSEEEEDSDLGRMAICICISGWLLNDESEYDTPFGVEPRNSDVAARLRLFYSRYNPDNVKYAAILATEFKGREDDLERECLHKYGASPFDSYDSWSTNGGSNSSSSSSSNAAAPKNLYKDVSEAEKEEVFRLIASYDEDPTTSNTDTDTNGDSGLSSDARRARLTKKKSASSSSSSIGGGVLNRTTSRDEDGQLEAEVRRIVGLQLKSPPPPPPARRPRPAAKVDEAPSHSIKGEEGEEEGTEESALLLGDARRQSGGRQQSSSGESGDSNQPRLDSETSETLLELVAEDSGEVVPPWWLETFPYLETFTLRWESKALFNLGSSVMEIVASLGQQAALEVLTFTAAATLVSALAWPITLLQAADMIDSTWTMACEKADRAGQLLAQVLMKKEHGHRPVVMVGFSMGARVIMSCLLELAKVHKAWEVDELKRREVDELKRREQRTTTSSFESRASPSSSSSSSTTTQGTSKTPITVADLGSPASGLVHTVVLMGAPISCNESSWRKARGVVADRFVNCYSRKDWVLKIMYRYQKLVTNAAGIAPVNVAGVENVDVTDVVPGHQHYATKIKDILVLVGLDDSFCDVPSGGAAKREEARARRREADSEIVTNAARVEQAEEKEEDEGNERQQPGRNGAADEGAAAARGGGSGMRRESWTDAQTILY